MMNRFYTSECLHSIKSNQGLVHTGSFGSFMPCKKIQKTKESNPDPNVLLLDPNDPNDLLKLRKQNFLLGFAEVI